MMKYRKEIDGLRAFAVISVIIYHAKFSFFGHEIFPGGYVGVDIFFVISGYLISKLIFMEIDNSGRFDFVNFYLRRARRIFPALFSVLVLSAGAAYFLLVPTALEKFAKSLAAAIAFGSNFYFYFASTEYGATSSLLMPLLHTWSLGIEEQFYIVFPVVALLMSKVPRYRITILVIFLLCSLLACVVSLRINKQLAFFLLHARAWELLAGGWVALVELKYGKNFPRRLADWGSLLGLGLVIAPVVFFGKETPHPGFLTIFPIIGTVLIIYLSNTDGIVGRVLTFRGLGYIGRISYSLYLWHFPVFSFWRIAAPEFDDVMKVAALALSLILSVVSYHVIEQPFRRNLRFPIWKISGVAASLLGVSAAFAITNNGFSSRLDNVVSPEAMNTERARIRGFGNFIGDENGARPVLLVVGDSYVTNWSVAINELVDHGKYDVVSISYLGCELDISGEKVGVKAASGPKYEKNCSAFEKYINDAKIIGRVVAVFLASHRPFEYKANKFRFDLLSWIQQHGNRPETYVFGNYFQLNREIYDSCLGLMFVRKRDASVCLQMADYPAGDMIYQELPLYPRDLKFEYIDIIGLHCSASKNGCSSEAAGVPFMMDWNHLSVGFLTKILKDIIQKHERREVAWARFFAPER